MKEKLEALVAEAEKTLNDVIPYLEEWGYDETSGEVLENALVNLLRGLNDLLKEE